MREVSGLSITWLVYLSAVTAFGAGLLLANPRERFRRLSRAADWGKEIRKLRPEHFLVKIAPLEALLQKRREEKANLEICEGISFLRNMTMLWQGRFLSADAMVEQLAAKRGMLSLHYGAMLRLLRQNQKEAAAKAFAEGAGTEISGDFARLLVQWDELDPEQLMETLLSYQLAIKEVRATQRRQRDELISDLIYLPVVINVMLVFINFIYVGYFIDQKEMLGMMG